MASEYVQQRINYKFLNIELLQSALKAAHRSDDGSSDDGNRGFAAMGMRAIEIVEAHHTIFVENGTKRDVDTRDRWFRSYEGRARVCKTLGIDDCVVQSVRQQHEKPSLKVLSYVMTAIIGAVWLDLDNADESVSYTRKQVFDILRSIEDVIADTPETPPSTTNERTFPSLEESGGGLQANTPGDVASFALPNQISDQDIALDDLIFQRFDQNQSDAVLDLDPTLLDSYEADVDLDFAPLGGVPTYVQGMRSLHDNPNSIGQIPRGTAPRRLERLIEQSERGAYFADMRVTDAHQGFTLTTERSQVSVSSGKRKISHDGGGRPRHSSLHRTLLREELEKLNNLPYVDRRDLAALLDDSRIADLSPEYHQVTQLRLLYLAIGSPRTLTEFIEILRAARSRPNESVLTSGPNILPSDRFKEICRLDNQEVLCGLARRYHVIKLFDAEMEALRQNGGMVLETPSTFSTRHRAQAGNPVMRQEAESTDALLLRFKPELVKETEEFERFRKKVKQLRRLAKILRILTDTYGFGILALLPYGPTYSELVVTDSTLLTIGEQRFRLFSDLLYQQQGQFLRQLSKAVEPAFVAFADGYLLSRPLFPIESIEVDVLESIPKGAPVIFEHLLGRYIL
ncbi:hypothetical protein B0J12DRAFT_681549 [Macrophomina phaseolina]|uniref:RNase III domain-containing protein n=1 Tax=Macrophomina phaseolina TaxID=35725 RepID=A0ABQ8FWJ4_9PEZI|nr:hypothetical protein B0J12DRAFT_681549 [Macrophomina phaseolina]